MAFNQFPYTDLYTLNLDRILAAIKELRAAWTDFNVNWGRDVAAEVDAWLEAHPEATTTVMDGSISAEKLVEGLRVLAELYVTPQMFGAVGDGVADDYAAFYDMLDSGMPAIVPEATYKLSRYLFTDESVVVMDRGNYVGCYLVVSAKIADNPLSVASRKRIPLGALGSSTWISGACFKGNHLIVAGYDDGHIYEYDLGADDLVRDRYVPQIKHANAISYDPLHNQFVVAPYCESDGTLINDTIVLLNEDLSYKSTVNPGSGMVISQVARDDVHELYWISDATQTKCYDDTWTLVATISHMAVPELLGNYKNIRQRMLQGSDCYAGQFLSCVWFQGHFGEAGFTDIFQPCIGRLTIYDNRGQDIKSNFDVPLGINEELEDVGILGEDLVLISAAYAEDTSVDIVLSQMAAQKTYLSSGDYTTPWIRSAATYASNAYVPDVNNVHTYHREKDNGLMRMVFQVNAMPDGTTDVVIGNANLRCIVPFQGNLVGDHGSVVQLYLDPNGTMYLSNRSGVAVSDVFRATFPLILR